MVPRPGLYGPSEGFGAGEFTMASKADENASLARRYLADVVAAGDRSAVDAFLAADASIHDPVFGAKATGWPAPTYGSIEVDVRDVVATAERVAVRGIVRGSHRPSLDGLGGVDGRFEVAQSWFCRVERGRIAELWRLPDGLSLAQQLGVLPDPTIGRDGDGPETDSNP